MNVEDMTLSLRVALFLIGMALIAAIWIWGMRRRRGRYHVYGARPSPGRRRGRAREPAIGSTAPDRTESGAGGRPAVALAGAEVPRIEHEPDRVRAEPRAGARRTQMELRLDSDAAPEPAPVAEVIVINIEVEPQRLMRGPELANAMRTVGMQYGAMQVFHHHGVGQLRAAEPLFSLANLFEPGIFDLARLDTFETRGVSLFMRVPTPIDGKVAFELLLHTAHRLADIFSGTLTDERHRPLNAGSIEALRQRAGTAAR
jgi:cell division protein ZipA